MNIEVKWLIFIASISICAIACISCDQEEMVGGRCDGYNHIYDEKIGLTFESDSLYFFIASTPYIEGVAPIYYELFPRGDDWLADTLIITLHVYGNSPDPEPDPKKDLMWSGDTLVIWYSHYSHGDYCDLFSDRGLDHTPPCPPPYYRIDYITIVYPEDKFLVVHEDVLFCTYND